MGSDADPLRVAVVGGTRLPGNVRTLLRNVRRLLADHPREFDMTLLVRAGVEPPAGFEAIDPGFADTDRALETLRTLTSGLTSYAASHEVDVLFQVTKFPLHGCATAIAGRRTGTPVLARLAGDNFGEFRLSTGASRVKAFGLNNVVGHAPVHLSDRIVVLGPHGRNEIEKRSWDARVVEIPQPVDREQFSPVTDVRERELADELGFPADERVLLSVGRLTKRKGMDVVARTARRLHERGHDVTWYVLGEGPLRADLEAAPGVEPVGRVTFERIPDYYRAADLVVHPSRIEGLPNVLLEAAACGTPTVARDVGDCATVASETFDQSSRLLDLVLADHEPVPLGDRFDPETLRERYATALVETARGPP